MEIKENSFFSLLEQQDQSLIISPQIKNLLTEAQISEMTLGVVTSSEKLLAHKLLDRFELKEHFSFVITREDTELNKPNPDPYLLALSKTSFKKDQCVIFEDSNAGLSAAKNAGIKAYQAGWY